MMLVQATEGHALDIALRDADAQEILALTPDAAQAIIGSIRNSPLAWTWLVNGAPACIFGVAASSLLDSSGRPWLVSSDTVPAFPMTFLRACKRMLPQMMSLYSHLENYVDHRHTCAVKWLAWLGFTIHPAEPFGMHGVPFHRFEMSAYARAV